MKRIIYISIFALLAIVTNGCKSSKTGLFTKKKQQKTSLQTNIYMADINTANFNNMIVSINLNGNMLSSKASMKIVKDSIIQLSIMPILGIEMARINFTLDSVFILDKIHSKYLSSSYDSLLAGKNCSLNYYDLQGIMLNQIFTASQASIKLDSIENAFSITKYPEGIYLKAKKASQKGMYTEFSVNNNAQINIANIIAPSLILKCVYSDFTEKGKISSPDLIKFSLMQGPITNNAELSIKNVEFNTAIRINASSLSNYTRVESLNQIIPN